MIRLTLYSTTGCHLCEEAHALLEWCLANREPSVCSLRITDIADDPTLMENYGILIPVLRNEESGWELNWPFGPEEIMGILQ